MKSVILCGGLGTRLRQGLTSAMLDYVVESIERFFATR